MTTFRDAVQGGRFSLSAELALKRESTADDIASQAEMFRDRVDGMQVTDNPLAWVSMSSVAAAGILLQNGIDPVPILTCRDRNRIGLMSDLLGLRALGVTSALLGRGRRVGKKHALHASTVFDMSGRELIAMAAGLNEEESSKTEPLFIGTGCKAHRAKAGTAFESLMARSEAGAEFLQTQLCFNIDTLKHWLGRMVEAGMTWRYSIMVSVTPLASMETAQWVKDNMPDSKIPDVILERLEAADDPEQEGVDICAETMREIAEMPGISGVHLISTGSPELLARAIDASGIREE